MNSITGIATGLVYDTGVITVAATYRPLPQNFDPVGGLVTVTIGAAEDAQQAKFMKAAGQLDSPVTFNWAQAKLYARLVEEEFGEFALAAKRVDKQQGAIDALELTEMIDGAADLIVVAKGFLLSLGIDPADVMKEVWRSNLSKVIDGKLQKRDDGKVLKPVGWTAPNFSQFNPLLIIREQEANDSISTRLYSASGDLRSE